MLDIAKVMQLVDVSFATESLLETRLREIDRRALNAIVLVKRHGEKLAGYGVVAQAFREGAGRLLAAAEEMNNEISPLIHTQMRILQHQRFAELIGRMQELSAGRPLCTSLFCAQQQWQEQIAREEQSARQALQTLLKSVDTLLQGILEQEYIVTNARIEAALSENSGAPLMQVSRAMSRAVEGLRDVLQQYQQRLEELSA